MKKRLQILLYSLMALFMAGSIVPVLGQDVLPAPGTEPQEIPMPATADTGSAFFESHIKDKLEVGTRITHVTLLEDTRGEPFHGSFVGSITMLKEAQDYMPIKAYVQYRLQPCLAVGISYDRFGAEAWDQFGTDGTTWLYGPLAYVSCRYQNSTRFTPYGELGMAYYLARFDNSSGWGTAGNKHFYLNDTQGYYAALGCETGIANNWSADLYGRYMNVDVNGAYYMNGQKRDNIIFTMSNLTLGLGVKYTF